MESQMYTPVAQIRKYLAEHRERPFIICEYTHAMGNSNGAMQLVTPNMPMRSRSIRADLSGIISTSPSAPRTVTAMKPLPTAAISATARCDYNFCGNGIVYGDGEESPKMQAVKYNYQNIIAEVADTKAVIANRAMFTNTGAFDCVGHSGAQRRNHRFRAAGNRRAADGKPRICPAVCPADARRRICGDALLPPEGGYRRGRSAAMKSRLRRVFMPFEEDAKARAIRTAARRSRRFQHRRARRAFQRALRRSQGRPDQLPLGRQGDAQIHSAPELLARARR